MARTYFVLVRLAEDWAVVAPYRVERKADLLGMAEYWNVEVICDDLPKRELLALEKLLNGVRYEH